MRARRRSCARAGLACALLAATVGAGRCAASSTLAPSPSTRVGEASVPPPRAVASSSGAPSPPLPLRRARTLAPPPALSPSQAAEAAALGLTDPATAAAFFGLDPPVPDVADPDPVAERPPLVLAGPTVAADAPPTPTPTPAPTDPPLACALTVSADLPPGGAPVPACSPVTVYATVTVQDGLPPGAPPLDGFVTFATDGIAATAPLRLTPSPASSAGASATVTRWRVHPVGKDDTPAAGAALTAWYSPAGGNSSACVAGSSAPLAVPVARSTPLVSVSPNPATLAKAPNATCDLKDLHARVVVAAAGGVTDCATPTGLVTLHVVPGDVRDVRAANFLPSLSQATKAKVAQVAAAEATAAALKAGRAAAERGSWKAAAAAGLEGAREEAVLLALDGAAGLGKKKQEKKEEKSGSADPDPSQAQHAADIAAGGGGPAALLDRARAALLADLPPLPFGRRRRRLLGPIKAAIDSHAFAHRKVGAGVLLPTQLLPGQPGHALIVPAGGAAAVGPRLIPGRPYTLVAQYSGDDNFEKAAGVGALVVDGSCPLA
jgi:hypothetical protein